MRKQAGRLRAAAVGLAATGLLVAGMPAALAQEGSLTLTPGSATNPVGTTHTVTATLEECDPVFAPPEGVRVDFFITAGPNAGLLSSNFTDDAGEATFTYTSNGVPGTDTIHAQATIGPEDGTGVETGCDPAVFVEDDATKTWVAAPQPTPEPTPGPPGGGGTDSECGAEGGNSGSVSAGGEDESPAGGNGGSATSNSCANSGGAQGGSASANGAPGGSANGGDGAMGGSNFNFNNFGSPFPCATAGVNVAGCSQINGVQPAGNGGAGGAGGSANGGNGGTANGGSGNSTAESSSEASADGGYVGNGDDDDHKKKKSNHKKKNKKNKKKNRHH